MKRWRRGLWVMTVAGAGACSFNSNGDGDDGNIIIDGQVIADGPPTFDSAPTFDAQPTDSFAAWKRRTHLRLGAASVPQALTAFPALVRLQAPAVDLDNVQNGGNDLRFVTFDGVQLSYDIERISNVELVAWVRIPLPAGVDPRLDVWMYYENPAAAAAAAPASVWAGQTSVHHLGTDLVDVTGEEHGGTIASAETTPTAVDGLVGFARKFDGNDLITVDDEADFDFTTNMTASFWMKADNSGTAWGAMLGKGVSWRVIRADDTKIARYSINGGSSGEILSCNQEVFDDLWHHVVAVHSSGSRFFYRDGVQCNTAPSSASTADNSPVTIGATPNAPGTTLYKGTLDEVRISGTAATPARVRADYLTVTDPNFVTVVVDEENL